MATILPIRLHFRFPEGWYTKPPDEVGMPGVAFVAGHPASKENGVTANVTLAGELRPDSATLAEIAESEVSQARKDKDFRSVQIVARREIGEPDSPGLVQVARVLVDRGPAQPLIMVQVSMSIWEVGNPRKRVVLTAVLTATPGQIETVIGDFEEFLRSLRPAESGEVSH